MKRWWGRFKNDVPGFLIAAPIEFVDGETIIAHAGLNRMFSASDFERRDRPFVEVVGLVMLPLKSSYISQE